MAKQDNVPVLFLELVEQGDSGFVLDGTKDTGYEQRLTAPEICWIPTDGWMRVEEEGVIKSKPIRHIAGCETIDPEEQNKRGIRPNRNNDKIPLRGGFATIRREGRTVGTYDYLKAATYFADNPLRPDDATAVYREVKRAERAAEIVGNDELITKAKMLVYELRVDDGKSGYKYNEERIDTYCRLLGVGAESYSEKVMALLGAAIQNPRNFIAILTTAEQKINTQVAHGVELKVISFDKNTVIYADGNGRVIKVLKGNLQTDDKKIEQLSEWFGSAEGTQAYEDFVTLLKVAQEQQLNS